MKGNNTETIVFKQLGERGATEELDVPAVPKHGVVVIPLVEQR
jgi:hypothetical protein